MQPGEKFDLALGADEGIALKRILVKRFAPDPKDLKPDAEGLLKWTLDLKPGEKREIALKFSIDHPADVNVSGLE